MGCELTSPMVLMSAMEGRYFHKLMEIDKLGER